MHSSTGGVKLLKAYMSGTTRVGAKSVHELGCPKLHIANHRFVTMTITYDLQPSLMLES